MDKRYDIFISYSRRNLDLVRNIKDTLEKAIGVNCWMDLNAIESGAPQFGQDIVDGINGCKVFLFMLSEQSQDSDNALLELNYARDEVKHVVLVNIDDCRLNGAFKLFYGLTDRISWSNQPQREKLLRDLKRWTHDELSEKAETNDHGSQHVKENTFLKLKSDLDCTFYLDGEEKAKLKTGKLLKFPLREGEYELRFVSLENDKDATVEYFVMPAIDKLYDVKLMPVRERRLEQELAEAEATEQARQKAERELAEAEQKAKEEAERLQTFTVNGVSFDMIKVEGGTFWMGADNGLRTRTVVKKSLFRDKQEQETYIDRSVRNFDEEAYDSEKPVHNVTVSTFHMGETEVTQALWKAVMGTEPTYNGGWTDEYGRGNNYPAYRVSWDDCQEFIRKLNSLTGKSFRLPTEAEWEYAARGGSRSNGTKYAGSGSIGSVAWYTDNSGSKTHPVKGKSPNELGFYDMSGNVWEWCGDWYGDYGSGSQTNPKGPSTGSDRVLRGGSWNYYARSCRVSYRYCIDPGIRYGGHGFRLCLPQ